MVSLDTDQDHIIHEIGREEYPVMRHMMVRPEAVERYEEVAVADIPPYTRAEYNAEVERLIAERYTLGQEIQFAREGESAGAKYAAYLTYVEQCKAQARDTLTARGEQPQAQG